MASHMKTTVQISDALLAEVQKIAAKNKTTLRALVQEGLQHVVSEDQKKKKPFKLKDMSVGGEGLQPEFQNASWEEIRALVYEGRGG
jgi:Arc/MetJ family transcription regulator